MPQDQNRLVQHYEVLMRLAKSEASGRGDLDTALREITEAAARTMDIARVNVWLYDEHRTRISCVEGFDLETGEHARGLALAAADYPAYFQALEEERLLAAHDARSDPRTSEFTEGYLDVHGITSMMDAPLHSRGTVIGIVCHEHIGPPRVWTPEEQQFAGSLADLAALAFEASERRQAEQALVTSERRTRQILLDALDAIVTIDDESTILDWNPRAEIVFGWSREEAIGRSLYDTVIPPAQHEAHRAGIQRFLESGTGPLLHRRVEITARDKTGREFPVELSVSPQQLGGAWVFSAFVRDITKRVRAEQEIHELNTRLEERVHERTTQLQAAITQKERLLDELQHKSAELADKLTELERQAEVIHTDLERAQVIQRALLPSAPPRLERVHVDALYRPGMNVGGDLYDITRLDDRRIALYVADATGHGVSAAMLSVLFKQRLQMREDDGRVLEPAEVLRRVNASLRADVISPGLFLTAAYAVLDTETYELRAASAGHAPMVLLRVGGDNALLERTGPALGIEPEPTYGEHRLSLARGDRLVLYTDGLTDGLEPDGGGDVRELIVPALRCDVPCGPDRLRQLYEDTGRGGQARTARDGRDDVTLVLLEISSGPSHLDNAGAEPRESARGELTPQPPPAEPRSESVGGVWMAEDEEHVQLDLRGRCIWTTADAFRDLALGSLASGQTVTVGLAECTYLDSTFLGILHELVTEAAPGRVLVAAPRPEVQKLFDELGLERVLAATVPDPPRPPGELRPVPSHLGARGNQRLLLSAHERLSAVSEENRARFAGVVRTLRDELEP